MPATRIPVHEVRGEHSVRTFVYNLKPVCVLHEDGRPKLVLEDIASALGYSHCDRLLHYVSSQHKWLVSRALFGTLKLRAYRQRRNVWVIDQAGLEELLLKVRKEGAASFWNWAKGTIFNIQLQEVLDQDPPAAPPHTPDADDPDDEDDTDRMDEMDDEDDLDDDFEDEEDYVASEPYDLQAEPLKDDSTADVVKTEIVPFMGTKLEAGWRDGRVLVSIKRLCEGMKVDHKNQLEVLRRQPWATVVLCTMVGRDGRVREHACLDLDQVPMWLAGIDSGRVGLEAKPLVIAFQLECVRVLRDHFFPRRGAAEHGLSGLDPHFLDELASGLLIINKGQVAISGKVDTIAADVVKILARLDELERPTGFRFTGPYTALRDYANAHGMDVSTSDMSEWGWSMRFAADAHGVKIIRKAARPDKFVNTYPSDFVAFMLRTCCPREGWMRRDSKKADDASKFSQGRFDFSRDN